MASCCSAFTPKLESTQPGGLTCTISDETSVSVQRCRQLILTLVCPSENHDKRLNERCARLRRERTRPQGTPSRAVSSRPRYTGRCHDGLVESSSTFFKLLENLRRFLPRKKRLMLSCKRVYVFTISCLATATLSNLTNAARRQQNPNSTSRQQLNQTIAQNTCRDCEIESQPVSGQRR